MRKLCTGLFLIIAINAGADVYVNFSADKAVTIRKASSAEPNEMVWNFSETDPLFNGNGNAGTKIYGALRYASAGGFSGTQEIIAPGNGAGWIAINATPNSGGTATAEGVFLWDKKDFLSGTGRDIEFDSGTQFRADLFRNDGAVRWVVRDGSKYYISEKEIKSIGEIILNGVESVKWAAWSPADDFTKIPADGFSMRTFGDVTGAGVYFRVSSKTKARFVINKNGFVISADDNAGAPAAVSAGEIKIVGADSRFFKNYNWTGIVYKTVNGQPLDMALFLPEKKYDKMPLMVYTHGGGWGGGDKTKIFNGSSIETLNILLSNGIAVAAVQYRLNNRDSGTTANECVVDCIDAVKFLVKHAGEYGIDTDRIGTWGSSAGGHLCLMTALASPELFPGDPDLLNVVPKYKCIASYFPLTSFIVPDVIAGSNFENPARFAVFLGGSYEEKIDLARKLSPVEYLKKDSPAILLLHGDSDQAVAYRSSTYMFEKGKEIGADIDLLTVKNGLHGFGGENIQPSMSEINRLAAGFIIEKLLK